MARRRGKMRRKYSLSPRHISICPHFFKSEQTQKPCKIHVLCTPIVSFRPDCLLLSGGRRTFVHDLHRLFPRYADHALDTVDCSLRPTLHSLPGLARIVDRQRQLHTRPALTLTLPPPPCQVACLPTILVYV